MSHPPVDVIIPVYNQIDLVAQCIESLLSAECETPHCILVIDDCSTEIEVRDYLAAQAASGLIELHTNPVNLGFTRTVNFGMQVHPDRDVVLLNSDTIVYKQWLDRLRAAAMVAADVATANPMTTQLGSHISCYPGLADRYCDDLEVDDETLDRIAREVNARRYQYVHVTVGFCMYIRRTCLDDIGYFDSINFPIAYGEESDFCYRARKAGWRHVIAGDVFVTHLEGRSFSERKQQLMNDMFKRFIILHPETAELDQRFIRDDRLRTLRTAIDLGRVRRLFGGKDVVVVSIGSENPGRSRLPWLRFDPDDNSVRFVAPSVPDQSLPNIGIFFLPHDNLRLNQALSALGIEAIDFNSRKAAELFEGAVQVSHPDEIGLFARMLETKRI